MNKMKRFRPLLKLLEIKIFGTDDSFFISDYSTLDQVSNFLNSFHSHLRFTRVEEIDNLLNFLDISVVELTVHFDHYCKPTYTGRIINFVSNQPFHYKFNTAKCFFLNQKNMAD